MKKVLNLKKRELEIGKGIFMILFYFLYTMVLSTLPLDIFHVSLKSYPMGIRILYSFSADIFLICFFIYMYRETLIRDFKNYKKHFQEYIDMGIRYWIVGVIIMSTSSLIIAYLFESGVAQNEQAVRSLVHAVPYYMLFSTAIYAPIIEELTFRKAIKDIFGKTILFILCSGLIFGGMHVVFSMTSWVELFQIIPYSSLGIVFAILYYKTDNIFVPISMHFTHNFLFTLLIMVLGL